MKNDEERETHPGWAVQFEDGSWLCIAHGVDMVNDAFYANKYSSEKEAESIVLSCIRDEDIPNIGYRIVPAWEPLCERLRVRIASLKAANKISPDDIMEMTFSLESVLSTLKKE